MPHMLFSKHMHMHMCMHMCMINMLTCTIPSIDNSITTFPFAHGCCCHQRARPHPCSATMRVFINEHGYVLQMPDRSRRPASVEDVIGVVLSSQLPPFVKNADLVRALQVDSGVDCAGVSTCSPRVVARQLVKLLGPQIELAISAVCSREEPSHPMGPEAAGNRATPAGDHADQEVELSWKLEDLQAAASETEAWVAMSSQLIKPAASAKSFAAIVRRRRLQVEVEAAGEWCFDLQTAVKHETGC